MINVHLIKNLEHFVIYKQKFNKKYIRKEKKERINKKYFNLFQKLSLFQQAKFKK